MVCELSSVSPQNDRVPPIPADEVRRHKACSAAISNVVRRRPNPQNQSPAYRPTRPSSASDLSFCSRGGPAVLNESSAVLSTESTATLVRSSESGQRSL